MLISCRPHSRGLYGALYQSVPFPFCSSSFHSQGTPVGSYFPGNRKAGKQGPAITQRCGPWLCKESRRMLFHYLQFRIRLFFLDCQMKESFSASCHRTHSMQDNLPPTVERNWDKILYIMSDNLILLSSCYRLI